MKTYDNAKGLHIRTVFGYRFEVLGKVTFEFQGNGDLIYYCDGQSFPAEIVTEIIMEDRQK